MSLFEAFGLTIHMDKPKLAASREGLIAEYCMFYQSIKVLEVCIWVLDLKIVAFEKGVPEDGKEVG